MTKFYKKKEKKEKLHSLVYGIHPIIEILKAKRRKIYTIYTTRPQPKSWSNIERLLNQDIQVQYVNKNVLDKISGTNEHQSVVAITSEFIIRKKFFDPVKSPFLIMLDGVQDPRNLGAILRSGYCTGVDGVILTRKASAPLNATAIKASAGLAEHLEIYQATSAGAAVNELKNAGYSIYLATLEGEDATKINYQLPLCLVIGGEGFGISKSILDSGFQIKLPQKTSDISYNASVAAGILLFIIAHQKGKI